LEKNTKEKEAEKIAIIEAKVFKESDGKRMISRKTTRILKQYN
jgi:hypothetical protein